MLVERRVDTDGNEQEYMLKSVVCRVTWWFARERLEKVGASAKGSSSPESKSREVPAPSRTAVSCRVCASGTDLLRLVAVDQVAGNGGFA